MSNRVITLDKMKDMPIDHIIDLYRQGHILEGIQIDTNIINLQACTATISADRTSANAGDFIRLTAIVDPPASGTTVTFKAETMISSRIVNYDIGTCDASSGTCYVDWDTAYRSIGAPIHVTAVVTGPNSCTSDPIDIQLRTPPPTWENVIFIAIVAIPASLWAVKLYLEKS